MFDKIHFRVVASEYETDQFGNRRLRIELQHVPAGAFSRDVMFDVVRATVAVNESETNPFQSARCSRRSS